MTETKIEKAFKLNEKQINYLLSNNITTVEQFAKMTNYDLLKLNGDFDFLEIVCLRDQAKYYIEFDKSES